MSPARRQLTRAIIATLGVVGACVGSALPAQATRASSTTKPPIATPPATLPPAATRPAAPAASASDPRLRWARVTYLSGDLVYIDAGTVAGLREKSVADVVRRDSVVAVLEVQFVSSSRAAARRTRGVDVVVGDSVRFLAAADAVVTGGVATPPPATRR